MGLILLCFWLYRAITGGRLSIYTPLLIPVAAILYFFHEGLWDNIIPQGISRYKLAKEVKKIIRPNLFEQATKVSRQQRELLNKNESFTMWFTGLSGAGKSTIAAELEASLFAKGYRTYILDGDNTRLGINSDLSFSKEDRAENIRRVAEICKILNEAGIIVIASFISPFEADRLLASNIIGTQSFMEVYINSSLAVCQSRDTKGLYKLAEEGKIKDFTGINSPYEAPVSPHINLHTDAATPNECVAQVIGYLNASGKCKL